MEISQFNQVIVIVAISIPAMFIGAIVLLWVLERTVFKFTFCQHCKEMITEEMNRRGYQGAKNSDKTTL
jgi:hypothetical protein